MPDIESIQFFNSMAAIVKRKSIAAASRASARPRRFELNSAMSHTGSPACDFVQTWGPLYKPGEVCVGIGMEMAATVVAREFPGSA